LLTKFETLCFVSVSFSVPWKPGGLDTECEEHEAYLNKFRETVSDKLQTLINRSLEEEPEIKARNKTVQVSRYAYFVILWPRVKIRSSFTYPRFYSHFLHSLHKDLKKMNVTGDRVCQFP
jgi:hypothetical protein